VAFPCLVGNYVTVGHSAVLHACRVGDECLIGIGAVVLDGAEIGAHSIVGARAFVPQRMKVPPGSMVMGAPARVVRRLTEREREQVKSLAARYVENGAYCLKHKLTLGRPPGVLWVNKRNAP